MFFWQEEGFSVVRFIGYQNGRVKAWFVERKNRFVDLRLMLRNARMIRETKNLSQCVVIKIDPKLLDDLHKTSWEEMVKTLAMLTATQQFIDQCFGEGVRNILNFEFPDKKAGKMLKVSVKDVRKRNRK